MARPSSLAAVSCALLVVSLLAACGPQPHTEPGTSAPSPEPTQVRDGVQPAGVPADITTGLAAPWSILRIPLDGAGDGDGGIVDIVLVSERDSGDVQQVMPDGSLTRIGTIPGVAHAGEGGLLGLAYLDDGSTQWLYAYLTTAADNRIIRIPFGDELGISSDPEIVLQGIAKAGNHNGGRIAFGPDGMLYATSGDAGNPDTAQDPASLNGKILRMTPTGGVPDDNPMPGSLTYSFGHRNPQGLTWDGDGQLWAAEFGQNTWDEFNRIEPGGNYGWPVIEGKAGDDRFIDPWLQWGTDDASPSGLTWMDGTFFMAALGGERLWAIYVDDAEQTASAVEWFTGEYGRIRDVTPGRDGSLWMLTNNTDGRGAPREGDDRILQVRLVELVEG
jgi:glucose/arabinose dehydrogenase